MSDRFLNDLSGQIIGGSSAGQTTELPHVVVSCNGQQHRYEYTRRFPTIGHIIIWHAFLIVFGIVGLLTSDAVVPPPLYVEREQVVSRPVRRLLWEQATCDLLGEEGYRVSVRARRPGPGCSRRCPRLACRRSGPDDWTSGEVNTRIDLMNKMMRMDGRHDTHERTNEWTKWGTTNKPTYRASCRPEHWAGQATKNTSSVSW